MAEPGYRERPVPCARGVVWSTSYAAGSSVIVPDGCMDLLWTEHGLAVAGPDGRGRLFASKSPGKILGFRFWPGVLPQILRTRADELADAVVHLDAVVSPQARAWSHTLDGDPDERALVLAATRAVRESAGEQQPSRVAAALGSGLSIAEVADLWNWSPRHLQRLSHQWFGYGPKHLQRVLRLRRADRLTSSGASQTEAAAATGFADAAHLWRERRALDVPQTDAAKRSTALPSGSVTTA